MSMKSGTNPTHAAHAAKAFASKSSTGHAAHAKAAFAAPRKAAGGQKSSPGKFGKC